MARSAPARPAARHGGGRRRRAAAHRRLRPGRPGRASSARRCSSTTRPTCGPGAARRWPPSATAWPTRPRRSCAWPWPGWPTRRACTSTWPPAASSTSRWPPACRPSGSCSTATTSRAAELRTAREAGVGRIVVDSFDELDRLAALHADDGLVPRGPASGPRPGVEAHTHEFVRTGQDDSKFGFGVASGDCRPGGGPGRRTRRRSSSSASTCTSAARSSWPTSSTRRSRSWPRGCASSDLPELSIGGGLGRGLRRGRGGPHDHRVGHVGAVGLPRRRASPPG